METTIAMLRQAEQEGIQTMIATPHYQAGQSKATAEQLQQILEQVQKEAAKEGINVEILLGNEL